MSTVSRSGKPAHAKGPGGRRLWCTVCGSAENLMIDTVRGLNPPRAGLVDVEYSCLECGSFFSHAATVAQTGMVLNRPGGGIGVLQFGGVYFHCGKPMPTIDYRQCSVDEPGSAGPGDGPLGVYLSTTLLRCRCGFQLEIPDRT